MAKTEEKFYLSPFEMKIQSLLKGDKYAADRRLMAKNQPSVAPGGKLYSSSKFVGDPAFVIGDVFSGFDPAKQKAMYDIGSLPPEPCLKCAIRSRCNYVYDSLARGRDGIVVNEIAPIQCAHEQIITPVADYVTEKLCGEKNALFIHKHYNEMYPVVSLVEDKSKYCCN